MACSKPPTSQRSSSSLWLPSADTREQGSDSTPVGIAAKRERRLTHEWVFGPHAPYRYERRPPVAWLRYTWYCLALFLRHRYSRSTRNSLRARKRTSLRAAVRFPLPPRPRTPVSHFVRSTLGPGPTHDPAVFIFRLKDLHPLGLFVVYEQNVEVRHSTHAAAVT